jgi:hypothetical protein
MYPWRIRDGLDDQRANPATSVKYAAPKPSVVRLSSSLGLP